MSTEYYMSGPEEGDKTDQTVLICDEMGDELFEIRAGSLRKRKALGRKIAQLLNEADAEPMP